MTIENFFLEGPAGRIECLLKNPPTSSPPSAMAAVVLHPHPLFGGTMHNKTVHATASALLDAGLPVLRFNFRGAGLSEGRHDHGRGEQVDCVHVIDHLAERFPDRRLLVAGYSFGAFVGLRVGCGHPRASALIGIGMPISLYDFSFLHDCGKPLTMIQGEKDPFGSLPQMMALAARVGGQLLPILGAAHNFADALDTLRQRVTESIPEDSM